MDPQQSQLNFIDYNSILIINPTGIMRQVFVPFRVQLLQDTKTLKKDTWVIVEEIECHKDYKLLYRITNHWWPYYLFKIGAVF